MTAVIGDSTIQAVVFVTHITLERAVAIQEKEHIVAAGSRAPGGVLILVSCFTQGQILILLLLLLLEEFIDVSLTYILFTASIRAYKRDRSCIKLPFEIRLKAFFVVKMLAVAKEKQIIFRSKGFKAYTAAKIIRRLLLDNLLSLFLLNIFLLNFPNQRLSLFVSVDWIFMFFFL